MSVTARGGYQIVDFKGTPITSNVEITIPGIFDLAKNTTNKPLLITGFVLDNIAVVPTFATYAEYAESEEDGTSVTIMFPSQNRKMIAMTIEADDRIRAAQIS